ncbi:hypothetical protein ACLB2K_073569 [Fragaria x ananassa]
MSFGNHPPNPTSHSSAHQNPLLLSPTLAFSSVQSRRIPFRFPIDGNGNKADKPSDSLEGLNWAKPLSNFAANNFLPIALVGGVALGFANPTLGCLADSYSLSKFSTFGIFIISGLTLHTGEIIAAADAWPVGFFGLV